MTPLVNINKKFNTQIKNNNFAPEKTSKTCQKSNIKVADPSVILNSRNSTHFPLQTTSTFKSSPPFLVKPINECDFNTNLVSWVRDGLLKKPQEMRQLAANRIVDAYKQNLTKLNLTNLGLSSLPQCIGILIHLEMLNLSKNNLVSLPESLGKLTKLEDISLDDNKITTIPAGIENLASLRVLSICHCHLEAVPEWIGKLKNLKILNLNDNKLKELPQSIGDLNNLIHLSLKNNILSSLPESMAKLLNLKKFTLEGNSISELPDKLAELDIIDLLQEETLALFIAIFLRKWVADGKDLDNGTVRQQAAEKILKSFEPDERAGKKWYTSTEINLSGLKVKSLPKILGKIKTLQILKLEDMQLTNIPEWVGNLRELQFLNISNNKISSLPESFVNLAKLKNLYINNNLFESPPVVIEQLESLYDFKYDNRINLDSAPKTKAKLAAISTLDAWVEGGGDPTNRENRKIIVNTIKDGFSGWHSLILSLNNLNLTSLPDAFFYLLKLNHLELEMNLFSELPRDFKKLVNLTYLCLNNNPLATFPADIDVFSKLETLQIRNIGLKDFPVAITKLTNLRYLDMQNNIIEFIPDKIGSLIHLESFYLNGNALESLPSSIGLLRKLKWFYVNGNKLGKLPREIGHLTELKKVFFDDNLLTYLPDEIGQLENLEEISANHNPNLLTLPMTLGRCTRLQQCSFQHTSVPSIELTAIQDRLRAAKSVQGCLKLANRLPLWILYSGKEYNLNLLFDGTKFNDQERANIELWLERLEKANDFKYNRKKLSEHTCDILESVGTCSDFKEAFFGHLSGNLEACGDRAAILFNIIFTEWKLHFLPENSQIQEKIDLLASLAKTLTLRNILRIMIEDFEKENMAKLKESAEIYLYYETHLKRDLGLLTAIEMPIYPDMGNSPNVVNIESLKRQVLGGYLETLINLSSLEKVLEKDEEYDKYVIQKKMISDAMTEDFDLLSKRLEEPNPICDGVYNEKCKEILIKKDRRTSNLRKRFIEKFI